MRLPVFRPPAMRPPVIRSPYPDRELELDVLALLLLGLAGAGVAAAAFGVVQAMAPGSGVSAVLAALTVSAATLLAWIFGYPQRAALPAMASVLVCAFAALPLVFSLHAPFLTDAQGVPPGRLHLIAGLYVGGTALILLAFCVFGFLLPLAGAVRARLRRLPASGATLTIHLGLIAAAGLFLAVCRLAGAS